MNPKTISGKLNANPIFIHSRIERPPLDTPRSQHVGPATVEIAPATQNVEVAQGQTGLLFEISGELAQQRCARLQQCPPRPQPAPAWEFLSHEAIEEERNIGFRKYLLMQ